jgi:hypothetical protein
MKQYEKCPHCGGNLVLTSRGKATATLKAAPKFRSKAEKKAFIAWTEREGLTYAVGDQGEYDLIEQFRREFEEVDGKWVKR